MAESGSRYKVEDLAAQFKGERITIVGNEPTGQNYAPTPEHGHVWVLDTGIGRIPEPALAFMMDDIRGPALEANRQKNLWLRHIQEYGKPIITSYADPEFPALVEYPLKQVAARFNGLGYFADTLAYMLAWAIYVEVAEIGLVGCDYYQNDTRSQRSCAEFWLSAAFHRNIKIMVHPHSLLMHLPPLDGVNRHVQGYYGYVPQRFPLIGKNGGAAAYAPQPTTSDAIQAAEQQVGP